MNVTDKVRGIVAAVCEVDVAQITGTSSIGDFPKWDSVGHLTIIAKVEEAFNINFEPEEMMDLEDVDAIVKAVEGKQ